MKRITMTFDVSPENGGDEDFRVHLDAWKYKHAVDAILTLCRNRDKYSDETTISIEDIRNCIRGELDE